MTDKTLKELKNYLLSNENEIATGENDFSLLFSVFNEIFSRDPEYKN